MIKAHRVALCALLALSSGPSALAAEAAGMVKVAKGQVSIERNGKKLPAAVGSLVEVADRVRTGADASVGVTLRDNTLLSAGPNSLIVIEKFAFDNTTQDGNMSIRVRQGTLSVASGKIAKRTPESVDFHTPTSVLGVRGTEFVIEVEGAGDE
ncbi:MAG: FecR domain-containing protein [Gammaproteobacteria bacterium]|nr:FecR domain-containing protein [Gammaproteobacteria bacterium]MBU1603169.1 FecR domain-containing protein [Gammaproteobacteria bacterium]MBU2432689.1 FecR domain-containing protein [Gammaproteobacteria bacterium]MBU2451520.1 FecR domain-containing protein [Gammaproteobacteria bacterium]